MAQKMKLRQLPIPKRTEQVNEYITAIADATNESQKLVSRANEKLSVIQLELAAALAPLEEQVEQHSVALFTYFEKNKGELTDDGKRQSVSFGTGVLGQRWNPPKTKLKNEQAVLKYIVDHRLTEFYEEKNILRRDALLANQAKATSIPGVSFVRDRVVFVRPDSFEVEIELKKKVEPV